MIIGSHLYGQSGIFDRTGIMPGHGSYSSLPEESVDLFTGNVTLRYLDYRLPGPNGLDVEIWRVYNSKILQDQSGSVKADHKSWVGIGWTMHMGRVHNYDTTTPSIEFPDGRWETTYPDRYYPIQQKKNITRDFLRYDRATYKLYFQNGVVWSFGVTRTIPRADGSSESVRLVSLIQNSYGHSISIQYDTLKPSIDKITDSMGRIIDFTSTGMTYKKLTSMKVKSATGSNVYYYYSVDEFPNGYHRLVNFTPPLIPATTYEYLDGTNNQYELTKVTTSYGGLLEYSYVNHTFYFNLTSLDSRVVSQKKITFNPGEQAKVWNFTYPSYYGTPTGTTTVEGPEFSTSVTSHAYDASFPWKIGLISSRTVGDGSASVTYDWTFQQISILTWMVLGVDMGTAKGPLLSAVIGNKAGDSTLKTECLYEREETNKYGLPTRINVYPNGAINPKNYTELSYFYETSTDYRDKYMLAYVSDKKDYAGDGALMKRTTTSYFQETGKWGAVDWIRRYSAEATYHTWDYGYICSNPNWVKITIDPPGDVGVQEVSFSYGIKNEFIYSDGVPRYSRVISPYDSSVLSEENQHGGTLRYTYDSIGRVTYIERLPKTPTPFNDTSLTWRPGGENEVVITQGGNAVTIYWDGTGRATGSTETGGGTTLYSLKVLDAEGRLKDESVGSTDPAHRYAYLYNDSGRVTRITDPQQNVTNLSYLGTRTTVTVTDPELRTTLYDYEDLPGQPTKVTDALGRESEHTYDAIGRLVEVVFNREYEARTHSYQYDWLDNVLSENHPETGEVSYFYDSQELRLDRKTWGTTEQKYNYNEVGQLSNVGTYKNSVLEESITIWYDLKGRLGYVSGSSGWSRTNITYNIWGSVMGETISIAGLSSKSLSYTYDNDNNQSGVTYPDGKSATISYNTLNMPQAISFNGKTIVDTASYGAYKNPVSISIEGNGTSYSATYSGSGQLGTASLSKGAAILYDASYAYDGVGNIRGISSTSPAPPDLDATFVYDKLDRLTSATYTTGRVSNYAYEYDACGNMLTARENGGVVFEQQYDGQNRIAGLDYDERGNLLSWGDKNYYWDSLNRLRYITSLSGEVLGQYLYDDRGLRLRALPPLPEINIKQDDTDIPDEGSYYFRVVTQQDKTFTVENLGNKNLELGEVIISGQDADCFDVIQQPSSPVIPLLSTPFIIRFDPLSGGLKTATLTLQNDDPDENPYNILLFGNYVPEIDIYDFANGSSYDFGTVTIGYSGYMTFTIQNLGTAPLTLTSSLDGPDSQHFGIDLQPSSPVPAGETTDITIRFSPTAEGLLTAFLSIASDDADENPYIITLYGTGEIGLPKIIEGKGQIDMTFPDGDEILLAGTMQTIVWSGGDTVEFVRIEYSADNGSTYRVIADRTPNNGSYNWIVPKDVSSSCLIRVTEAEGRPFLAPKIISFEFSFKISSPQELYAPVPGFSVDLGVPDFGMKSYNSLVLEFAPYEASGNLHIAANNFWAAPKSFDVFLDRWHRIKAQFDLDNRIATIWMDNEILYDNVSLNIEPIHASYGALSFSSDASTRSSIRIDDVEVNISDPELKLQAEDATNFVRWKPIFADDFEAYRNNLEPLRRGGWVKVSTTSANENSEQDNKLEVSPLGQLLEAYWIPVDDRAEETGIVVDSEDSISGLRSLRFEDVGDMNTKIIKIFSLPAQTPFDKSKRSFMVVSRIADTIDDHYRRLTRRSDSGKSATVSIGHSRFSRGKVATGKPRTQLPTRSKQTGGADVRMASALPVGTYYIYAFDGRLLAEYNALGFCTKDYIYMANRLIAEYHPSENKYYYYTSDQINSTRIVTDDFGTVVYAAAHDPYGGIQKTWEPITFDPSLKFSGKERDVESGLDYFGPRYYDRSQYRLLSPNRVVAGLGSMHASHSWNAYSYPGNHLWAEMLVVAGWTVSATNIAAIIQPKPPEPEPEPPWWSVSYPWVSRPEDSLWVLIESSGEKRRSPWKIVEQDWRKFLEKEDKVFAKWELWNFDRDEKVQDDFNTGKKELEIQMWNYLFGYEYGSDPVLDAYLANYGMSMDPDNPLSFWNPCYMMLNIFYDKWWLFAQ
jgi:RHS repeat-associated protein